MPQCPICNTAVWLGERYCATCDNYLPRPEEGEHFCPRCGLRVAPQQEICHKCKTALPRNAGTASKPATGGPRRPPGVYGTLITTGMIITALLVVFLFKNSSGPPHLVVTPPSRAPAKQTPVASPVRPTAAAPSVATAPVAHGPAVLSQPAAPSPPAVTPPAPSPPRCVVKINYLALRDGPSVSAAQIATFNLNDEVELLETSGAWGRVRDVRRNIVGWCNTHYLERGRD